MNSRALNEKTRPDRRRFLGNAANVMAVAGWGMTGTASAQTGKTTPGAVLAVKPGTHHSFMPLKQIDAGVLNVGYAEAGPADGPAVLLLHGWPYDIHSFVDVAPLLATKGYRVIVPYYEKYRHDFNKLIWRIASPKWQFDDATYERSAAAFGNPDHVAIAIHNYRWRLGLAEGESRYDSLEHKLAQAPAIRIPTITMEGDANGAPHPSPSAYAKKFSGSEPRWKSRRLVGVSQAGTADSVS
jgi:hypothetical protein